MLENKTFPSQLVTLLSSKVSRRSAFRKFVFGSSVVALTPVLGGIPGVDAASFGVQGIDNVRLLELTGTALQKDLGKFKALSEYRAGTAFLASSGFDLNTAVSIGYQIFTQTGTGWSSRTILEIMYTPLSGSDKGSILYLQDDEGITISVQHVQQISAGLKIFAYKVNHSTVALQGTAIKSNGQIYLTSADQQTQTIKAPQFVSTAEHPLGVNPTCLLCFTIFGAVVALGCSWWSGVVGCSIVCGGPEDLPCLGVCAILFPIICAAAGGISVAEGCSGFC